MMLFIAVGFSI